MQCINCWKVNIVSAAVERCEVCDWDVCGECSDGGLCNFCDKKLCTNCVIMHICPMKPALPPVPAFNALEDRIGKEAAALVKAGKSPPDPPPVVLDES